MRIAFSDPSMSAPRGPRGTITGQAGGMAVVRLRYRTRGVRAEQGDGETRIRNDRQFLRQVAVLFDAPIQEVLIATGYMTEKRTALSPRPGCRCNKCQTSKSSTRYAAAQ